ncbi:PEP-CTERM sorting domain-containing protein [Oscillatoria sp. FACHB-1406]|uniref:PEP-CTERM sorting domain-containing protein n=1 Tax=Oscillatoria sp. FACHB-1406 TaxID=2692846 RepID=UPI00168405A2|nr:PEP-CTERM sorting domain-containing protein [Oscillatoria sp. FACHB-1406]MBD2580522.1 PEP-CTERM sorting domain-containing protein [Oscillatoria sp. FACHB-1406]
MESKKLGKVVAGAVVLGCAIAIATPQAKAGTLYDGWNYSIDSFSDGSGGSGYEIQGLAIKETADSIFVALTGGTPLTGVAASGAADGNIGWGDMFFNFSGKDFATAQAEGSIFGVHFAGTNDSGVSQLGLYGNVVAQSVTLENHGYGSLKQYYDWGWGTANTMGTDIATQNAAYNYLYGSSVAANPTTDNTPILNSIQSGNFLGAIASLNSAQLLAQGLNFGHFSAAGSQTLGFQLDKSLLKGVLPAGLTPFMVHVLLECGNDGVALAGNVTIPQQQEVPEPATLLGLGSIGLAFWSDRKRRATNA